MYQDIKHREYFYTASKGRAERNDRIYTLVILLISVSSALLWSISNSLPAVWAIVISLAQFAQALNSFMPWKKQLTSLKFLLPELSRLTLQISSGFDSIDISDYDEYEIQELISTYQTQFYDIENRYTSDVHFSEPKKVLEAADKRWEKYFYHYYPEIKENEKV